MLFFLFHSYLTVINTNSGQCNQNEKYVLMKNKKIKKKSLFSKIWNKKSNNLQYGGKNQIILAINIIGERYEVFQGSVCFLQILTNYQFFINEWFELEN